MAALDSKPSPTRSNVARSPHRVVVGVDGSQCSERALAWAVGEAQLRNAPLEIVHASFYRREALEALDPEMIGDEKSLLEGALAQAKSLAPDIALIGRICDPPPEEALIEASDGADLLVVGSRGLTGLKEITLGSVSSECARHALCPVVIVRTKVREPDATTQASSEAVRTGTTAKQ